MTAANISIIEAYETLGMTPEQIAETQGYDIVAIKTVLMQFSRVFRESTEEASKDSLSKEEASCEHLTKDEIEEAYRTFVDTMRYAEDDKHLKFKAACRIVDEGKGRLDKKKELQNTRINVVQFNLQLINSRKAKERALGFAAGSNRALDTTQNASVDSSGSSSATIDIESEKELQVA